MKENFPNLAKEIDFQEVQEAQRVTKKEEKVKAMQSEIKKNRERANSKGKEIRTQITDLEWKEEINIQLEQNEETRIFFFKQKRK